MMFKFDKVDVQRIAVSSVGAAALSAACIFGVAGPAHAAAPVADAREFQNVVESQLDANNAVGTQNAHSLETDVAVRFTAAGDYAGATVARSSGDKELDRGALLAAREIAYPTLPAGYGKVTVRILHDASMNQLAAERVKVRKSVQYASVESGAGVKALAK